jgi:penicillin-binding protein 1C
MNALRLGLIASAAAVAMVLPVAGFHALDRAFPLKLEPVTLSAEVVDRDGALLRPFATPEGRWRLGVDIKQVDPEFINMLITYEDKRFRSHHGVDVLAMSRAAFQFARHGRIVSGGSTLSMQLARLMEPRGKRAVSQKLKQMFRAIQIERQMTKDEILHRYLTLAPYGGNLEGVRAASLAYFGKEPRKLLLSEAALLVALPQSPEARRPDRNPKNAKAARDRVLERMADAGTIERGEVERASAPAVNAARLRMPAFAAHLSDAAIRGGGTRDRYQVTLRRNVQAALEAVAKDAARRLGANLSVSVILADSQNGEILAEVGSANYFDRARSGWIDMTRVPRSPGSTLKPFIYGLALEQGIAAPETLMEDRPSNFGGYRPRNFDTEYRGSVTLREALQLSLNVPAVQLLDSVGAPTLVQRFRRAGLNPVFPKVEEPGLSIGLGGVGLSLADLVQAYAALANGGTKVTLTNGLSTPLPYRHETILSPQSAWQVTDMLAGIAAPANSVSRPVAYKTGTSYGYRDAWSIGYDGRYVIGVWVGRADNGAVPGSTGGGTAAPILFEAFARSGLKAVPFRRAPSGTQMLSQSQLPEGLRKFTPKGRALVPVAGTSTPPEIIYPPQGARVELARNSDQTLAPLALKLQGGRAPFRWLANGLPLNELSRRRTTSWTPDSAGFSKLTVIDAAGKAASVEVFIE